jgi:GntR family transcriptional regulator/MocR family aminotransferase
VAHDFRVGLPDARLFPYEAWRPLIARELRPSAAGVVGYGDPAGHAGLRAALARHIGPSRGVRTGPDDVLVTTGTQQALDLIGQEWLLYGTALSDDGESALSVACVAHEDPLLDGREGGVPDDPVRCPMHARYD